MTQSNPELAHIAKVQARHQKILIVLSVLVTLSTIVTWKSVKLMREANDLQRQSLNERRAQVPAKSPVAAHTNARRTNAAASEPRPVSNPPGAQQRTSERPTAVEATRGTQLAGAKPFGERFGRQ